jgi:hypothetical protein
LRGYCNFGEYCARYFRGETGLGFLLHDFWKKTGGRQKLYTTSTKRYRVSPNDSGVDPKSWPHTHLKLRRNTFHHWAHREKPAPHYEPCRAIFAPALVFGTGIGRRVLSE